MAANPKYVGTPAGAIKILHIIFGIITIGCGGHSYESEYVFERVFIWSAVVCFVISFIYLIGHLATSSLSQSNGSKGGDMVYHVAAGLLLIIGGSLMIVSVKDFQKNHCEPLPWGEPCVEREGEKLAGASFSIINGIFYLIAVALIAKQKSEEMEWDPRVRGYPAGTQFGSKEKSPEPHS